MPTPIYLDGFEHRTASVNDLGATDGLGIIDTVAGGAAVTIVAGRNSGWALQCAAAGAAVYARKNVPGTDPTVSVVSLYIKFTTLPTTDDTIFAFGGPAAPPRLMFRAASGKFALTFSLTPLAADEVGPVLSTGTWYLVDLRIDVSSNPHLFDGRIDGGTNVQRSNAVAASTITFWQLGSDQTDTFTSQYDDFVASNTGVDYPMGAHKVLALLPTDDNAGQTTYGTNVFEQGNLTDLSVSNKAWQYLDDWPVTNADAESDPDHVTQSANSATYVQVVFGNTSESAVWGAVALAHTKATTTGVNSQDIQVRTSAGGAVADLYVGDNSEVNGHYRTVLCPAIDTVAELNDLEIRVGNASSIPGNPEWGALMIQYAVPDTGQQTLPGLINQAGTIFAPTISTTLDVAVGLINQAGSIYAVTIDTSQQVLVGFINQAGVLYNPSFTTALDVNVGLINQAGVIYAVTIDTGQQVLVGFINQAGTLFVPSFSTSLDVPVGLISQIGQIYAPTISNDQQQLADFIQQIGQIFAVSIGDVTVPMERISQIGVVFAPFIDDGSATDEELWRLYVRGFIDTHVCKNGFHQHWIRDYGNKYFVP